MAKAAAKHCCHCANSTWAIVILIIGILYLLQDLGTITFWTFSWWTVVFILCGLMHLFKK